jgi:hypothetical protein
MKKGPPSRSPLLATAVADLVQTNGTNPSSHRAGNESPLKGVTFGGATTFGETKTISKGANESELMRMCTNDREELINEKVDFLEKVIPQMFWMTTRAKRSIADSFKERIYLADQVMITEGEKPKSIILIREGDCELFSSKNPLKYEYVN